MRTREIKNGSLYSFDGVVCRVRKKLKNNKFLLSYHKNFYAIADARDLNKIGWRKVKNYLDEVDQKMS